MQASSGGVRCRLVGLEWCCRRCFAQDVLPIFSSPLKVQCPVCFTGCECCCLVPYWSVFSSFAFRLLGEISFCVSRAVLSRFLKDSLQYYAGMLSCSCKTCNTVFYVMRVFLSRSLKNLLLFYASVAMSLPRGRLACTLSVAVSLFQGPYPFCAHIIVLLCRRPSIFFR